MSKNIYPSRYSNGKNVSAAQYITELICEHKANKDRLDLHFKFWVKPEWEKYYKNQIGSAHKLLKKYKAKAIIKALQDKKTVNIYSLRAPHLIPIIEQYQLLAEAENTDFTKEIQRKSDTTYQTEQYKFSKSKLSKIRELDNES